MRRSLLGSSLLSSSYVRKSLAFVYEKTIKAQKISSKELKQVGYRYTSILLVY